MGETREYAYWLETIEVLFTGQLVPNLKWMQAGLLLLVLVEIFYHFCFSKPTTYIY